MKLREKKIKALCILTLGILLIQFCGPGPFERGELGEEGKPTPATGLYGEVYDILRNNCSACHGPGNPTRLAITGDPEKDYDQIKDLINTQNPEESILLKKASGQVSHGGGKILDTNSEEYKKIKEWIAQGAKKE